MWVRILPREPNHIDNIELFRIFGIYPPIKTPSGNPLPCPSLTERKWRMTGLGLLPTPEAGTAALRASLVCRGAFRGGGSRVRFGFATRGNREAFPSVT